MEWVSPELAADACSVQSSAVIVRRKSVGKVNTRFSFFFVLLQNNGLSLCSCAFTKASCAENVYTILSCLNRNSSVPTSYAFPPSFVVTAKGSELRFSRIHYTTSTVWYQSNKYCNVPTPCQWATTRRSYSTDFTEQPPAGGRGGRGRSHWGSLPHSKSCSRKYLLLLQSTRSQLSMCVSSCKVHVHSCQCVFLAAKYTFTAVNVSF